MAEVTADSPQRIAPSYFPSSPPHAPDASISYCRSVQEAPYKALVGVIVDARYPSRHPVTPRCRMRKLVGSTNRWRLPESLGSDLLGSSQAIKAITMPYNQSLINIITAESPQMNMHLDVTRPYNFFYAKGQSGTTSAVTSELASRGRSSDGFAVPTMTQSRIGADPLPDLVPMKKFVPTNARPMTPKDIFLYHSKRSKSFVGPDVLLKCIGMDWELHRPFLHKAEVLVQLLKEADDPTFQKYYRTPASETLDTYIKKNDFYSNDYKDMSSRLSLVNNPEEEEKKGVDHPAHISEKRVNNVTTIKLECRDPMVTKSALAVALGNLYHEDIDVHVGDVAYVLAAASAIGFKALMNECGNMMLRNITYHTVNKYHKAASKYQQEHVVLACEKWLELKLIPQLASKIQLRDVQMDLLQRIIKSNRLFTFNEYSVYKTLTYWLFLQLNPGVQLMPSHSTVLSYFNSLQKTCSFLEKDEGQIYAPLFSAVRVHGITDPNHIQDMQIMNILPQSKVINLLTQHYHSLQGGGDMEALRNFASGSVRQGFILDEEPHYHSEVLSLYGFHFELKAVRNSHGNVSFYMQRLKPGDPILSFRQCERQTFSMRPEREVRYCISVQQLDMGEHNTITTGIVSQKFGLGDKTSRSEVLKLNSLDSAAYVTFAVMFPAS